MFQYFTEEIEHEGCRLKYGGVLIYRRTGYQGKFMGCSFTFTARSFYACMYVCMVTHIVRVWINRVWLPILLVVSWTGKIIISLSAFAPEVLASRNGSGSLVRRQPAHLHTQAESDAFIYFKPPYPIGSVPSLKENLNASKPFN